MIVFDLRCAPAGHVFEAWFASSADYDGQRARGLVACPICASPDVAKAPMAPAVPKKGAGAAAPPPEAPEAPPSPAQVKEMMATLAAMQRKLLAGSEHVGDRFAAEARAIHLGEAEARAIHGRATRAEAESLADEGIPVAPLPLPLPDPDKAH
jgi:hypothetical protein